jgi:hypothetical protein
MLLIFSLQLQATSTLKSFKINTEFSKIKTHETFREVHTEPSPKILQ